MKLTKKIGLGMLSVILLVAMAFSVTACGGKAEPKATLTASYSSDSTWSFMSAYPAYTYKQATFSVQSLKVYSDGTYCLIDNQTFFSGALEFPNEGTASATSRGSMIIEYYGTYERVEEDGLVTYRLAVPTRMIYNAHQSAGGVTGNFYLDTDATWTDEMKTNAGIAAGVYGQDPTPKTPAEFLAVKAIVATDIIVDSAAYDFDYVKLVFPTPAA